MDKTTDNATITDSVDQAVDGAVTATLDAANNVLIQTPLNSWLEYTLETMPWLSHWTIRLGVIFLITLLLIGIKKKLLSFVLSKARKTKTQWDDAIISAASKPLGLVILLVGFGIMAEVAFDFTKIQWLSSYPVIRETGLIIAISWALIRLVKDFENRASIKNVDQTTAIVISKLFRLSIFFITALILIQHFGFSMSGVLAFGGIGGMAIGYAAKDLLANFFGGFMIHLDRPFSVGDWISSPDRDIEGTVEDIGWRICRIRTFDKRPLYIPNGIFNNIVIENPSRMKNRRINETFGIRYSDLHKMPIIISDVKSMLQNHPDIDSHQTLIVNFNHFNSSSVDFFIYTFTKTTDWVKFHQIKQDILLELSNIITHHQAEIAFPTSTLHIEGPLK